MKKTLLLLFAAMMTGGVFAESGVIKELSGTVELKQADSGDFIIAQTGDIIEKDTIVSTGFKSTALVSVGNSTIMVRPLTRLVFSEIIATQGGESVNLNLQSGRIRVDVQPPAGKRAEMTVKSPSATASVRGTSFDFDTRRLRVSKGTVAFRGTAGPPMLVSGGSSSNVGHSGQAADPLDTANNALTPPPPSAGGTPQETNPGSGSSVPTVDFTFTFTFE